MRDILLRRLGEDMASSVLAAQCLSAAEHAAHHHVNPATTQHHRAHP